MGVSLEVPVVTIIVLWSGKEQFGKQHLLAVSICLCPGTFLSRALNCSRARNHCATGFNGMTKDNRERCIKTSFPCIVACNRFDLTSFRGLSVGIILQTPLSKLLGHAAHVTQCSCEFATWRETHTHLQPINLWYSSVIPVRTPKEVMRCALSKEKAKNFTHGHPISGTDGPHRMRHG